MAVEPTQDELRELIEHQDNLISELLRQIRDVEHEQIPGEQHKQRVIDTQLVSEMREQMKATSETLQRILRKNEELETVVSSLTSKSSQSPQRNATASMMELHRELTAKESELLSVRTALEISATRLESAEASIERLEEELSDVRQAAKRTQAELLRKNDQLADGIAQKSIDLERLTSEKTKLQAESDELRELGSQRESVLREYCKRLEDENARLRTENTKLQYRMDSLREDNILLKLEQSRREDGKNAEHDFKEFTKLLDETDIMAGTSRSERAVDRGHNGNHSETQRRTRGSPRNQKKGLEEPFNMSLLKL